VRVDFLFIESIFPLCPYMVEGWDLFSKTLISFMRLHPHDLITSLRLHVLVAFPLL
jgi:hypothetical protein